ncbi:MAG: GNAT family N-acetyltransferase [Bacteroidota bacterium]|jgi:ribosomal protein S18 acetylase RimI-like enzyme|nr:GNAT family N-acetyltransferase [Chitinophagaceae bacterium]MCE2758899.1 GNAT family N-acetyltransferase [Chitinophagaceae bacterium]
MSSSFEIRKAGTNEINTVKSLSREIWMKVYPSIISVQQIEYMLELIYNEAALRRQMLELGHAFILLIENETPIGYASYSKMTPEYQERFRLHKFYLQPAYHGMGLGKMMMNDILKDVLSLQGSSLELNVNKYNPALGFYKKLGFSVISEEVIEIGEGYVMDDYIMELSPLKYPI